MNECVPRGESHRLVHGGEVSRRSCNNLPPLTLLASSDWVFIKSPAHAIVPARRRQLKSPGRLLKQDKESGGQNPEHPYMMKRQLDYMAMCFIDVLSVSLVDVLTAHKELSEEGTAL